MRGAVPVPVRRTQTAVRDRLQQQHANGTIADVSVHTWERATYVPTTDRTKTEAWEKFDAFDRWASNHGCELGPGFGHRRSSTNTGDPVERITLPIVCLAVYDDRSLSVVAPYSDGDRVSTVRDCLDALADEAPITDELPGIDR